MAKKQNDKLESINSVSDALPPGLELPESPAPRGLPADFQDEVDRHDHAVDNADRSTIDNIILSDDVGKGGKIRVERKGPLDSNYQWVHTMAAEDWAKAGTDGMLEYFRNNFGGGDYRAMTHRANGKTYKQFTFSIDRRYKGALDEDQIRAMQDNKRGNTTVITPPAADSLKSSDMIKIMEMASDKSDKMMALVMTMMAKSQETTATMMAAMITAMGNKQAQAPVVTPGLDPVIAELLKQKVNASPMTEVLETMRALKELQEPTSQETKEDTMFDKVMKAAGAFIPALSGMAQQAIAPAAPQQQLPQGQPGVLGALPHELQLGINQLLRAARRGSDPVLYADLIIDQLTENPQHFQLLRAILTDPAWKAKLFGDEQKVADIAPWLEELRSLILTYDPTTSPDEQAGGAEVPPPGNGGSIGGPAPDTSVS
jgi:hypothetical protein